MTTNIDGQLSDFPVRISPSTAHEIKNPLSAILNLLQLVRSENDLGKRNHFVELIEHEIDRVAKLAQDGLEVFRGSRCTTVVDVASLISSVLELYAASLEARGVKLIVNLAPVSIPADCDGLREVFANLVVNAIDAMQHGGHLIVRTHVAQEWSGQQRQGARVTIADDGCGIAAQDRARSVDSFFSTKGHAGTGFGLPLVKKIVLWHGGTLRLRSSTALHRSGTTIQIFLPGVSN